MRARARIHTHTVVESIAFLCIPNHAINEFLTYSRTEAGVRQCWKTTKKVIRRRKRKRSETFIILLRFQVLSKGSQKMYEKKKKKKKGNQTFNSNRALIERIP